MSVLHAQTIAIDVLKAVLVLLIGWFAINRFCKFVIILMQRSFKDLGVASFLESLTKFLLRMFLIVVILQCLGFDVTAILAAIVAPLVAVGMSLKDSVSNLVSGIALVINKPIRVGDYIECDGSKGHVVRIEMMYTFLQTENEDEMVVIPNSKLSCSSIKRVSEFNFKKIEFERQMNFVPKTSELYKHFEKEFLLSKDIFQVPAPKISIRNIEDGKIDLRVSAWCRINEAENVKKQLEIISYKFESKFKK
ncbi:MAG: mechanosensitive ion channel family protein [Acutalibacteraceae bacterium]